MARITETTEEEYLAHEAGTTDSSFTFIYRCAERLGVDLSQLVAGKTPKLSFYTLTRDNCGMPIRRRAGFEYLHRAALLKNRQAEPFVVKAPPQDENSPIHLSTHSGQEFDYILKGRLKVQLDDKIEIMEPGDSIMYDSSHPHGMIAIGNEPCEFLALVIRGEGDGPQSIEPRAVENPIEPEKQELIYHKFLSETLDEEGHLKAVKFHFPENYNFGFDVVDALAEKTPDKTAMVWVSGDHQCRKFTFRDISRYSNKTANYLVSLGIKKGDYVMLVLKRHYQFWFAMTALHKIGAIAVPATNQLQTKDFVYRFQEGTIKAIIHTTDGEVPEMVEEAMKSCPGVKIRIAVGTPRHGERDFNREVEPFSDQFARDPSLRAIEPNLMFFSSGTTGYPKMIMHAHTYSLGHIVTARWWQHVTPDGLHFTISDSGWGKCVWGKIYGQWLCEGAIFVYDFDRFDAADILSLLKKYNVTSFCAPPTMYRFFIREDLSKYDLSSIKYAATAGEALNPEVFSIFQKATGLKIMEGFGQTETAVTVGNLIGMTPKPGSMGKPSPQFKIELVNEDGQPVPDGEVGVIAIRANPKEVPGLLLEYRDPEQTAASWRNGLYYTGDTAWRDEDGYFWYVGRSDDLIKSSGYRIGPFEVESVIMELPYVLECAVVGVPDPIRGQVVKAFIVLVKGQHGSEEMKKEIQNYVKHHTAPYKYPRKIEFLEALPKTSSGKIRRTELRKMTD
ncbi:MAG: AMP-binding protein [Lentisphaeria bacterium]|nr:AMP-binding protein [Lentisphaeria bacterium]